MQWRSAGPLRALEGLRQPDRGLRGGVSRRVPERWSGDDEPFRLAEVLPSSSSEPLSSIVLPFSTERRKWSPAASLLRNSCGEYSVAFTSRPNRASSLRNTGTRSICFTDPTIIRSTSLEARSSPRATEPYINASSMRPRKNSMALASAGTVPAVFSTSPHKSFRVGQYCSRNSLYTQNA